MNEFEFGFSSLPLEKDEILFRFVKLVSWRVSLSSTYVTYASKSVFLISNHVEHESLQLS
jgi:hypothetical protein